MTLNDEINRAARVLLDASIDPASLHSDARWHNHAERMLRMARADFERYPTLGFVPVNKYRVGLMLYFFKKINGPATPGALPVYVLVAHPSLSSVARMRIQGWTGESSREEPLLQGLNSSVDLVARFMQECYEHFVPEVLKHDPKMKEAAAATTRLPPGV